MWKWVRRQLKLFFADEEVVKVKIVNAWAFTPGQKYLIEYDDRQVAEPAAAEMYRVLHETFGIDCIVIGTGRGTSIRVVAK